MLKSDSGKYLVLDASEAESTDPRTQRVQLEQTYEAQSARISAGYPVIRNEGEDRYFEDCHECYA